MTHTFHGIAQLMITGRVFGLRRAVGAMSVISATGLLFADMPIVSPLSNSDDVIHLHLLLPAAMAAVISGCLQDPSPELSSVTPHRPFAMRIMLALGLTTIAMAMLVSVGLASQGHASAPAVCRNLLVCVGLALAGLQWRDPSLSWILPIALAGITILMGYGGSESQPHWWSILLYPTGSSAASAIAGALVAVGLAAYAFRGAPGTAAGRNAMDS